VGAVSPSIDPADWTGDQQRIAANIKDRKSNHNIEGGGHFAVGSLVRFINPGAPANFNRTYLVVGHGLSPSLPWPLVRVPEHAMPVMMNPQWLQPADRPFAPEQTIADQPDLFS
jgi:hypothetical protein